MNRPAAAEVIKVIAEVEGLEKTLSHFPDLSRDDLVAILLGKPPPRARALEADDTTEPERREPAGPAREILYLWTDGASRGNPGPASIGVVLKNADGKTVAEKGQVIGRRTNNFAEYEAVRYGLECALHLRAKKVHVRADSQLIVRQLAGMYRVKNEELRPIYEAVKRLELRFPRGVTYEHVPREENQEADRMANIALDEVGDV